MARTKPGYQHLRRPARVPDSDATRELRSACKAEDVDRVRELFDNGTVAAVNATLCLKETLENLPLMRLLLEHGADPSVCARICYMKRSFDLIKLLVEFGYDIKINGHCILQDYADSPESIEWLLDHGVDINKTDHERTDDGSRPGQCHDFSLKVLNNVAKTGDIAFFDHLVSRGADPRRSMALHCTAQIEDPLKTVAMIDHLLDVHNMDLEADNENLRDFFHAAGDSGTPLNCAVHYHNLTAVKKLLERGAKPDGSVYQAIDSNITNSWLPAVGPLLDAGANLDHAFEHAVDYMNFEAARVCVEKGVDPRKVLRLQQAKATKKATGSWVRRRDELPGDGGDSSYDSEERAARRKEMREFVQRASDKFGSVA